MSSDNNEMWTAEHLRTAVNRSIHLEQRRQQLLPLVDDLRRVAREVVAELAEYEAIEGDLPGQARLRAHRVGKPLLRAADDIEKALTDLVSFNARFTASYEELPERRAEKRRRKEAKALAKKQTAASIGPGPAAKPPEKSYGSVFDNLRKGA
ncbi:hypothetical protein ACFY1V_31640 [Streptomyces sp. NPDC001255]|uniref:hypothetical protein n=1 Tax=Streptomyces sp. NPDC001255 TaxID=3364550 RepID=UPI0036C21A04